MDLRFWRTKEPEVKATQTPLSPQLQAILEQGPLSFTPDGSVFFFEAFGSSYGELYRKNSALRAVVDFLSRNIAQCGIRLFHKDSEGVALPAPDHAVQKLLDHPQLGVPRSRFMRQLVADKAIYDVAAIWKIRENFDPTPDQTTHRIRNTGPVRDLVRIPVPFISIFQGSLSSPAEFRVSAGRDVIIVPATDIVWMPGYSPTSNTTGTPPIETLRQILAEEWAAGKDRENYWKRGPQMHTVFLQDGSSADLTDEQTTRFQEEWQNRYGGVNASNSGAIPLIPSGLMPHEIAINAQTSEYVSTRTLAREEVCRAYGIQPQLLGITPSNFASMDMYHQMLYQDTLAPWMVPIQEEFEEQLLREFEREDSGYYLDFNINAKLQGSFLDQAKIGQQAVGGPWMTRNEFREKFQGLPPVDGGDEIIVPLNVVAGGGPQANPQDAQNQFTQGKSLVREALEKPSAQVIPMRDRKLKRVIRDEHNRITGIEEEAAEPGQVTVNNFIEPPFVDARPQIDMPDINIEGSFVNVEPPQLSFTMPEQQPPEVNVSVPVSVPETNIQVNVPEQAPPQIHVDPSPVQVNVPEQQWTVNVPETNVAVNVPEMNVQVNVPEQQPPQVHVETPAVQVNVPETSVQVNVPNQEAPQVHVDAPQVDVHVPEQSVTVNVPEQRPADVIVQVPQPPKRKSVKRVIRDRNNRITGVEEEDE